MKRRYFFLCLFIITFTVRAQTDLYKSSLSQPSLISPYYFGPNAFPVPDMLDGRVEGDLRVELSGDNFFGKRGDHTADVSLKVNIPLWTKRANLTIWMPVMEWYKNTDKNIETCRILDEYKDEAKKGTLSGDVFISTDMHLMKERKYRPDWTIRAALKTASGGEYYLARYYDSPGYFFDTFLAKSLAIGKNARWNHRLRLVASTGFLCWQTDNGRQNDAVQYGVMLKWENSHFALSQSFSGYNGWEHNSSNGGERAHDCPMVLKTNFTYRIKNWEIFACWQYGLRDYPYQQLKLGAAYRVDILGKIQSKRNSQNIKNIELNNN